MNNTRVEIAIKAHWDHAPVNIEQIIRDSGIALNKKADLAAEVSGQLERLDNGGFEISVNRNDHYYRQRFTMAHELGHYYLHNSLVGAGTDDNALYRSTASGNFYNTSIKKRHEYEANSFAAFILMPEKLVRNLLKDKTNSSMYAHYLSEKLQVSTAAMRVRLNALNIAIN